MAGLARRGSLLCVGTGPTTLTEEHLMTDVIEDGDPFATAERLLGFPLRPVTGPGEPDVGGDLMRLGVERTFGDCWTRPGLDLHSRCLISVTIAAVLGTPHPLGGQIRIALNNGVTKEEIVELFIHLQAYAGAARAVEGYQVAKTVFAESAAV
jgi:4-carboxymuconolactone decarboxylase